MSQDNLVKLVSVGDENGVGKGHTRYTRRNKKKLKNRMEVTKYNPEAKTHTLYKETK
jgi:ribosomal protein L33